MKHSSVNYAGPAPALRRRRLLASTVEDFHRRELASVGLASAAAWELTLGAEILFDRGGLALLDRALGAYRGSARELTVRLRLPAEAARDYYSLKRVEGGAVELPIVARRRTGHGESTLEVVLPCSRHDVPAPAGLCEPFVSSLPAALLTSAESDFDLLFANQIAVLAAVSRGARRSPAAWLRGLTAPGGLPLAQRVALGFRRVHPSAWVHPTAVVEGSVIDAGARVGAHCVVRYSWVGEGARLHDGAKAEFSTIGPFSWLMHDLVLFRCHVEDGVFLIHGPYQFSAFYSGSAAFATILMDYRPDGRPIKVRCGGEARAYGGPFLGAVLREGAKTLGGSLVAPGTIVPAGAWLAPDAGALHARVRERLPESRPVGPAASGEALSEVRS